VEPDKSFQKEKVDGKKALDFVNIVKSFKGFGNKRRIPYGRISKLLGMAQRHGDCFL